MSDLISRNEAWKAFDKWQLFVDREDRDIAQEVIENLPPVEAKPVIHGNWQYTRDMDKKKCSVCGVIHLIAQYPLGNANFCPNCGADMRGGKNE